MIFLQKIRPSHLVLQIFVLGLMLSMPIAGANADGERISVIVNDDVPVTEISRDEIQKIFLGRKTRWPNNQTIHFVVLKGGPPHETFLKQYIGKTPSQFDVYWKKMVFTGKGGLPKSLASPEDMRAHVAQTPGAIGYVPEGAATEGVKKLSVK